MENKIQTFLDQPHELEKLYRENPEQFKKMFQETWEQHPQSAILSVWNERLNYEVHKKDSSLRRNPFIVNDFMLMAILAVLAGITTRILFHFGSEGIINLNLITFGVIPFIAVYFIYKNRPSGIILYSLLVVFTLSIIYYSLIPIRENDSIILGYLHLPLVLWLAVGLAYTGNNFMSYEKRIAFLKSNGEFIILYTTFAISGFILSVITIQLFGFLKMDIFNFYFNNVVPVGAASLFVVSVFLVVERDTFAKTIAHIVAKIFSPLVLLTLLVYLVAIIWTGQNPFIDRYFLLSFNIILFVVLLVTFFSISESSSEDKFRFSTYVVFALVLVALLIDTIALSAILFRLTAFGITPNRIAVMGANLLIWMNLISILPSYVRYLQNKTDIYSVQNSLVRFLPIYGIWAIVVVVLFPLLFE